MIDGSVFLRRELMIRFVRAFNNGSLETELDPLFSNPIHCPFKRFIAVSNDIFVLVDGSKNINPRIFPLSSVDIAFDLAMVSNLDASSKIYSISSLSKSFIEIMFFNLKMLITLFI